MTSLKTAKKQFCPGDNFHLEHSHVLPALMRRFHEAAQSDQKDVVVWGSRTPMREFLFVDDMATASLFVMDLDRDIYQRETEPMSNHINVGSGTDVTIRDLAETIAHVTGYKGRITFDRSRPDGAPRKLMDVARLGRMGWTSSVALQDEIARTYEWYLEQSAVRA